MKYNASLDGVRALAAIMVVAFHTWVPLANGGFLGVDVFFVLSGFLITSILRSEIRGTDGIDLKAFYTRRFVRLMPALVIAMLGTAALWAVVRPATDLRLDLILGLLYLSDYSIAFAGTPAYLGHTWSLSVEEHFYIVWPLFLLLTHRLTAATLFRLIVGMFLVATAWKFVDGQVWGDFVRTYYRFDTRISGMLAGAALAVRPIALTAPTAERAGLWALVGLAFVMMITPFGHTLALSAGSLAAEVLSIALLASLCSGHQTAISKILSTPSMVSLGKLYYSIYLWHFGIARLVRTDMPPIVAFLITIGASILLAYLTHKVVEAPLRKMMRLRRESASPA